MPEAVVPPPEDTRSSKLTSLECSPRRDCTPPLLLGFAPVSRDDFSRLGDLGSKSSTETKSFKSKGFGAVDSGREIFNFFFSRQNSDGSEGGCVIIVIRLVKNADKGRG